MFRRRTSAPSRPSRNCGATPWRSRIGAVRDRVRPELAVAAPGPVDPDYDNPAEPRCLSEAYLRSVLPEGVTEIPAENAPGDGARQVVIESFLTKNPHDKDDP